MMILECKANLVKLLQIHIWIFMVLLYQKKDKNKIDKQYFIIKLEKVSHPSI